MCWLSATCKVLSLSKSLTLSKGLELHQYMCVIRHMRAQTHTEEHNLGLWQ